MPTSKPPAFAVKDCASVVLATGVRAQNLRELRDGIMTVGPESVHHHFWGGLLRARFDDPEFNNDFAFWVRHALHDHALAERLAVIDPADFLELEALRQQVLEVIEQRLDETEAPTWARSDQQFHFMRSRLVVFDTGRRLTDPRELIAALPQLSLGSIYYHMVDARSRPPQSADDFRVWLRAFGRTHAVLYERLAEIDPYFGSLEELRQILAHTVADYFGAAV